jgi:hypothetical protein
LPHGATDEWISAGEVADGWRVGVEQRTGGVVGRKGTGMFRYGSEGEGDKSELGMESEAKELGRNEKEKFIDIRG